VEEAYASTRSAKWSTFAEDMISFGALDLYDAELLRMQTHGDMRYAPPIGLDNGVGDSVRMPGRGCKTCERNLIIMCPPAESPMR